MTISALFGANGNQDSFSAESAKSRNANSTFGATLASLTRDIQQARDNAPAQAGAASSGSSSAASSANAPSSSPSGSAAPQTALGADAQDLASFAAAGITVTVQSIAGLNLPMGMNPSSPEYQQDLFKAMHDAATKSSGDTLSKSTFESLVAQFGGTQAQADQLFSLLGGDATGSVSNAQMLNALGQTGSDSASPTSQLLLGLMDTNGNRVVSNGEFTQFETAMVNAERGTSA